MEASTISSAVESGDVDKVRELFSVGATSDKVAKALHLAFAHGQLGVVRMLIAEFRADINCVDNSGLTPLHNACASENLDLARLLISEFKAEVNTSDWTPLHHACANEHLDVARMLISELKADVSIKDDSDLTPLHHACANGHVHVVRMLVSEFQADLNCKDLCGWTPLHHACANEHLDVARMLISEFKADVSIKDDSDLTPLHHACVNEHLDVVRILVSVFNADINCKDGNGMTPLHHACANGQGDVANLLVLKLEANVSMKDDNGLMPLHHACINKHLGIARLLVSRVSTDDDWKDAHDCEGNTPLHVAAMSGNSEIVLALINEYDCDIYIRGQHGRSLLHSACLGSSPSLVQHISQYISSWVVDDNGNTPLHTACKSSSSSTLNVLLKGSAPIMVRNNLGETPRDIASSENSAIMKRYMKENKAKIYSHYKAIQAHAKAKYSVAKRITRVFVIGNPGAGKSSLIETLKKEGSFDSFRRVTESSVPLHTAGIVPSIYTSKHYGRVLFYDFAGDAEYYSSHAAIIENFASSAKGLNMFFVVVDLRDEMVAIERKVHYWLSFVEYQHFDGPNPTVVIVGSHLDLLKGNIGKQRQKQFQELCSNFHECSYFLLDCCQPKSSQISKIQALMRIITKDSPRIELSPQASILLGMLEVDFSNVPACSLRKLISHIKETGMHLPTVVEPLQMILCELHDLGLSFMIKSSSADGEDLNVILHMSQLTNLVHKSLFSREAKDTLGEVCNSAQESIHVKVGVIPETVLYADNHSVLPRNITKECLTQLQYCQEINRKDVHAFPSLAGSDSSDQSFLFFPALCAADKSEVPWITPPELTFGIGWLARCTGPYDYFPPRFLHVLILRVIFHFILSVPSVANQVSGSSSDHRSFDRYCTMWKSGVRWLTKEPGWYECVVEVVNNSKEVVVLVRSKELLTENCASFFRDVISCVMNAKVEFCHSIKPEFFLLDSTDESDYLHEDNLFAMADVECALLSPSRDEVVSITRQRCMRLSKISQLRQRSYWHILFHIELLSVLDYTKNIVTELCTLGLNLNVPLHILHALEVDFPRDVNRRRTELIRYWLNSYTEPACWWRLVEALRKADNSILADNIEEKFSKSLSTNVTLIIELV